MRSKCRRYSSSSAPRFPRWACSTSRRTAFAGVRLTTAFGPWLATEVLLPADPRGLTPEAEAVSGAAEADPALARVPLQIHDSRQRQGVAAVLSVDLERAILRGAQSLLELLSRGDLHVRAHDLAPFEADLDADALGFSHSTPAPRALRAPRPGARTRPRGRRGRDAAPRRSARRPRPRAAAAARGDRAPRRRRGACPARGSRGTCRHACRHRAGAAARHGRHRRERPPPRRPARAPSRAARARRRRRAGTSRPPRPDRPPPPRDGESRSPPPPGGC